MKSHVVTLLIFLISVAASLTWSNVTHTYQVHDTVLPMMKINSHGVLSSSSPLPDWSDIKLPKSPFYVETLLAVDAGVSRFYGHNPEKLMQAIVSLMHAVNLYAFQLNIRIVVVDVVPVKGYNLSLEQFLEWRQEQTTLPPHDVAMLIRHRFEGGIAYVNGVCKRTAVGLCGFFPEAPFEYASVFFHELAHLLGLNHDVRWECQCSKMNRHNCLRIDGFEHDCSAQALVDLLPSHDCLQSPLEPLPRTNVPICGNKVVEFDEDCDCGLEGFCDNVFCDARSCRFILRKDYLYKIFTMSMALIIFSSILLLKKVIQKQYKKENGAKTTSPEIVILPETTTRNGVLISPLSSQDSCLLSPPIIPTRPAPSVPGQGRTILDQPIPIARNYSPPPGYTKMFPAKVNRFEKLSTTSLNSNHLPPVPDAAAKPGLHFYHQPPKEK